MKTKPKPTCIICKEELKDKHKKYCKTCNIKHQKEYYKKWVSKNQDKIKKYKKND